MFGIPVASEMVSGVKVKFTPARFTWPSCKCRTNKWTNSWWCWIWAIISQYWKHECCWKHAIAIGQTCNWVKEVGSSLTCLPLLWGLLDTLSSVVESLPCSYSCSYVESVFVMVLKARCMFGLFENDKMVFLSSIAKYAKGKWGTVVKKKQWEKWTVKWD